MAKQDKKTNIASALTLGDRLFTAFISAGIASLLTLSAPIVLLILLRGKAVNIIGWYLHFPVWGGTLIILACIAGFALGEERMLAFYAHLWGTATPARRGVTALIWAAIAAIGYTSVSLAGYWQNH